MQWLPRQWNRLTTFLREVVAETKKVTWPSKQEIIKTTIVVVIASFIFGIYLFLCDNIWQRLIQVVFNFFA